MAFFRSLRQNLLFLQDIFRKRKRNASSSASSSSRRGEPSGRDNRENNPVRSQLDSQQETPLQDIRHTQATSSDVENSSRRCHRSSSSVGEASRNPHRSSSNRVDTSLGTTERLASGARVRREHDEPADPQRHPQVSVSCAGGKPSPRIASLPSPTDSEVEDKGVVRCQCSRNSPFSKTSEISGLLSVSLADQIYGESDSSNGQNIRHSSKDRSTPSTSRGTAGIHIDTGHSSCSLEEDQLLEEMVSTLKTRGALSRRRSRSRSRRSRPRQSYENGIVVVNNVRVVHTIPRRETDSDESNTSLHDLPLTFRCSLPGPGGGSSPLQHTSASHSNLVSDSSFHSMAGSDDLAIPQPSFVKEIEEDEERVEVEEDWGGSAAAGGGGSGGGGVMAEVNSTEHNRSRISNNSGGVGGGGVAGGGGGGSVDEGSSRIRQREEVSNYGPEEFVLDLLVAMCRGTWSDIL